MTESEIPSERIASHEFHFVPPNEVHFTFRGEFDARHADTYLNFVFKCAEQAARPLYAIYDLSGFTRATDSGRKRVINVDKPYPYAAMAIIGANFTTRTVASMIVKAGKLVAPQSFSFPIEFLPTEKDAHAWFDKLRSK